MATLILLSTAAWFAANLRVVRFLFPRTSGRRRKPRPSLFTRLRY